LGFRVEILIFSHHSRFTCECNKEEINDDDDEEINDDDESTIWGLAFRV